jgi:ankyrin repeat protein
MKTIDLARSLVDDEHICRWLVDNGASVSSRAELDITPTTIAVRDGSMSIVRMFLERCHGIQGGQLLHFAIVRKSEDVLEVIELLLNLGCPVDKVLFQDDPRSWMYWKLTDPDTPLLRVVKMGKTDIVAYLLFRGADPAFPSTRGRTPLQVAESNGHTSIVGLLKQYFR